MNALPSAAREVLPGLEARDIGIGAIGDEAVEIFRRGSAAESAAPMSAARTSRPTIGVRIVSSAPPAASGGTRRSARACRRVGTHQNCQPLQAGAPCTSAPTWWIEPRCSAADQRAVGAHLGGPCRPSGCPAPCRAAAGRARPASRRGCAAHRASTAWRRSSGSLHGRDPAMRARAAVDIGLRRARCR